MAQFIQLPLILSTVKGAFVGAYGLEEGAGLAERQDRAI